MGFIWRDCCFVKDKLDNLHIATCWFFLDFGFETIFWEMKYCYFSYFNERILSFWGCCCLDFPDYYYCSQTGWTYWIFGWRTYWFNYFSNRLNVCEGKEASWCLNLVHCFWNDRRWFLLFSWSVKKFCWIFCLRGF